MAKKNDSKNKKKKEMKFISTPEYEKQKKEAKLPDEVVSNIAKVISKHY
ncbi:hypothetical protein [Salinicoccus halitifaciens]|uniref:Uncharacterized protein n=1 Tax=Salinicoccus halitifaciens TaxID=1073415 RepID=A0ABV2E6L6_9STAP|nr:hypothetical protein [Salinicoccus halitifaciens]MCD2137156.1 hypothetical protein [Salinicoccus halitifaciens]